MAPAEAVADAQLRRVVLRKVGLDYLEDLQRRLFVANGRPLDRVEHGVGHQIVFVRLACFLGTQLRGGRQLIDR